MIEERLKEMKAGGGKMGEKVAKKEEATER